MTEVQRLREQVQDCLDFIVALRNVLISMQPEMGYRPQQLAFSNKMTDNEILCGKAIEDVNRFIGNFREEQQAPAKES